MTAARRQLLALTFISLLTAAGCTNPMTRSGDRKTALSDSAESSDSSIRQASSSTKLPMTFLDSDHLQYGTGPMDDSPSEKFEMTASGLRYRILRQSQGRKPTARDSVTVNYRGWLDSGREFDSSYDRGQPISFALNGVIKGWTEGMQLIGEGGMIELWVPARLGYGTEGSGSSVPPNATLHFIVELIRVD
ncbi:MAG: FKBP-type peptidyl-prolyl cis-trans isomerase [Planctomycetaceae bacterium]